MNAFFIYLLRSSLFLAAFFGIYWFMLRHETFFRVNRTFLLLSGTLSMILPLLSLQQVVREPVSALAILLEPVLVTPRGVEHSFAGHLQWIWVAGMIYAAGMVLLLARFLTQFIRISRLARHSTVREISGFRVAVTERSCAPFSFFNMIFIGHNNLDKENIDAIILHEQVHIRQAHTFDLILAELVVIVQWFNPFAWFTARELKNIHEYLADDGVLQKGFPAGGYQQLILNETMGIRVDALANNFNISQIKNRIAMMTQKRSGRWAMCKILLVLPVIFFLGLLFSATSLNALPGKSKSAQESSTPFAAMATADTTTRLATPDKQPVFPGGEESMMKFMVENIKYPAEAMKKNITGKVYVSFNVEIDGSITGIKIIKGIGSGCDEEAFRVIGLMPKWKPGELKGKPVNANIVMPIKFALDCDKKEKPKK